MIDVKKKLSEKNIFYLGYRFGTLQLGHVVGIIMKDRTFLEIKQMEELEIIMERFPKITSEIMKFHGDHRFFRLNGCVKCNIELPKGSKFCLECGEKV